MGGLQLVGSLKLHVSFAKEPYKTVFILQKRPIILRSLLIAARTEDAFMKQVQLLKSLLATEYASYKNGRAAARRYGVATLIRQAP